MWHVRHMNLPPIRHTVAYPRTGIGLTGATRMERQVAGMARQPSWE